MYDLLKDTDDFWTTFCDFKTAMGHRVSHMYLSIVCRLIQSGSVTSGAEGSADPHLRKKGTAEPTVIKSSGNDLRRNKLIY